MAVLKPKREVLCGKKNEAMSHKCTVEREEKNIFAFENVLRDNHAEFILIWMGIMYQYIQF